jgi:hypothetical protein
MSSWVRYCVAVYVGLLISGALARPSWTYPNRAAPTPQPAQRAPAYPEVPAATPGQESLETDAGSKAAAHPTACATLIV